MKLRKELSYIWELPASEDNGRIHLGIADKFGQPGASTFMSPLSTYGCSPPFSIVIRVHIERKETSLPTPLAKSQEHLDTLNIVEAMLVYTPLGLYKLKF